MGRGEDDSSQAKQKKEKETTREQPPAPNCCVFFCSCDWFLWLSEGDQSETKGVARGGKDRLSRLFPMPPFP